METVQTALWVVVLLVVLAILFDFMNGFHDAANSIATVVSTGVLKPGQAVLFAAFFNVVAIFVFHLSVAATVGKGIVQPGVVDTHVVFGALVGAITWNVLTWYYGIPSSSSHALIGGIVGAVIAKAGASALVSTGILKTVAFIFVSPCSGFVLGLAHDGGGGLDVSGAAAPRWTSGSAGCNWFRRCLQPRARRQRCAKDHRHHLDAADCHGLLGGGDKSPPTWVIVSCYAGDWRGHHVRWLAHRQDHGPEDHQAQAGGRLLRRNGRCDDPVPGHRAGHSGVDHAHHHRRHCGRGLHAARQRRALGRGGQHRLGLDLTIPASAFVAAIAYWISLQLY
jgi:PiT family inorganic phosphate transporter